MGACPRLEWLDISENSLGDLGLVTLIPWLKNSRNFKHFIYEKNFDKSSKTRSKKKKKNSKKKKISTGKNVSIFAQYLASNECYIETLNICGSEKAPLKSDLIPFVLALMNNKSLKVRRKKIFFHGKNSENILYFFFKKKGFECEWKWNWDSVGAGYE